MKRFWEGPVKASGTLGKVSQQSGESDFFFIYILSATYFVVV